MRSTEMRNWQLEKCRNATSAAGFTSAIGEAPVVTHRAEVLKDKDGHGWDDEQHHKHHNPDVSTEGLWGRKKKKNQCPGLKQRTNRFWLIHIFIHATCTFLETNSKCIRPFSQPGLGRGGVRGCAWASSFPWWTCQGIFSFKHMRRTASSLWTFEIVDSFCHWTSIWVFW